MGSVMNDILKMLEMSEHSDIDAMLKFKNSIDDRMAEAFANVSKMRANLLSRKLEKDEVVTIESFFHDNRVESNKIVTANKYLSKYIDQVAEFWNAYSYYRGSQMSKGKFDLFESMKSESIQQNRAWYDDECAKFLNRLEESWIASSQIFTKYRINHIRKAS